MYICTQHCRLNAERYRDWDDAPTKPAVLAFDGPAYRSLWADCTQPDPEDLEYLQRHLRILSGLYGLLRPLDAIKPHRLEMVCDVTFEICCSEYISFCV